jgi:hypothetical protein
MRPSSPRIMKSRSSAKGGRIGVEEPLHAEPTHDTPAHLLGERGQIGLGNQSSRQERRRPVTGWHEDAVGRSRLADARGD